MKHNDDIMVWEHFRVAGGIHRSSMDSPHKLPVTQSFDVLFDARLDKRLRTNVASQ